MEKPINLILWKTFTAAELQAKGQELSDAVIESGDVEFKKKAAVEQFRRQLEGIEGTIQNLSGEIRAKGTDISTPCIVRFHVPRTAFKQIVRVDTGELVREEQMTPQECQENLFEAKEIDDLNRMMEDKKEPEEPRA